MKKLIPLLLIFAGESVAIYSEVVAARDAENFLSAFWKASVIFAFAGLLLIGGYMLGLKYLKNIWVVGAVSIASIIIMEPVITYLLFRELPSRGALLGFVFGILGLLSALFVH